VSVDIANCSNIPIVCKTIEELLSSVDGVLHARDDYEKHPVFLRKYIEAKKPCFIDKPFCLRTETAEQLFALDQYGRYVFTCSALLFSTKLFSTPIKYIRDIKAAGPKDWEKYAIHLIEPSLKLLNYPRLIDYAVSLDNVNSRCVKYKFQNNQSLEVLTTGYPNTPFSFVNDNIPIVVDDFYLMFKESLNKFIEFMVTGVNPISRVHTLQVISLIERGAR
jgi:hypothetical protein